jgi:hypothetical protein
MGMKRHLTTTDRTKDTKCGSSGRGLITHSHTINSLFDGTNMQDWIDRHQTTFWLVVFPSYFGALWCFVCALLSYISGWTTLASRYRCHSAFVGDRWSFQSGQMRWHVNYGNCLTVGGNPQGLYLAVMPLFRFRQPPLLIPWEEVTVRRRRFLLLQWARFELGRELHIPLSIRTKLAERLRVAAGDRWPV